MKDLNSAATRSGIEASQVSDKSLIGAKITVLTVGFFGVHRFYTGRPIIGIFMILTLDGLGIWVLVDFFLLIVENFRDSNHKRLVWPY
jgi:TM2 domain-containing membrane protein YozV